MVANLHFQLSWYNQITLLPPLTQHLSFFRNFHPEIYNSLIRVSDAYKDTSVYYKHFSLIILWYILTEQLNKYYFSCCAT